MSVSPAARIPLQAVDTKPDGTAEQHDTKGDRYQAGTQVLHAPPIMREDIARFYHSLAPVGRRVLGTLLLSLPTLDAPSCLVLSSLVGRARCSKLSVLRHVAGGEREQLFTRDINPAGRRHGARITPHKERCQTFLHLFQAEFGLLVRAESDTKHDRYQNGETTTIDTKGDRYRPANVSSPSYDSDTASGRFLSMLSDVGRRVLGVLIMDGFGQAKMSLVLRGIARRARCSEITARRTLARGAEAGLFRKQTHPGGPRFGVLLQVNEHGWNALKAAADTKHDRYQSAHDTSRDWYHEQVDTNLDTNPDRYQDTKSDHYGENRESPRSARQSASYGSDIDTKGDRYQSDPFLDRQKENLSVWGRRLLEISRADFEAVWPELLEKGFGPDQVRQIVEYRSSVDLPLDDIMGSLHSAQWQLANNCFPATARNIAGYLFSALKMNGTFRRPDKYVSPEQQVLAAAKRDLEAHREAQAIKDELEQASIRKADDKAYEAWLANLSDQDLAAIDDRSPMPLRTETARQTWRRSYWSKHVAMEKAS